MPGKVQLPELWRVLPQDGRVPLPRRLDRPGLPSPVPARHLRPQLHARVLLPQRRRLQPCGRALQVPPRVRRRQVRGALPGGLLGPGLLPRLPVPGQRQLCLPPDGGVQVQARVQGGGLLGAHGAAGPAASGRGRGRRRGRDRARPDARRVRREGRRGVPSVEHRSGKLNLLHLLLPLFDGFFVYF